MATVGDDLRTYLIGDSTILKRVGSRIFNSKVWENSVTPFIWFQRTGEESFDCITDAQGDAPDVTRFSLECVGKSEGDAEAIALAVKARCHKALKVTMGSRTATIFAEDQNDQYEPRPGGPGASGFHIAALAVEVYP